MTPRTSQIEPPPRSGTGEAAIILAVVALQTGLLVVAVIFTVLVRFVGGST